MRAPRRARVLSSLVAAATAPSSPSPSSPASSPLTSSSALLLPIHPQRWPSQQDRLPALGLTGFLDYSQLSRHGASSLTSCAATPMMMMTTMAMPADAEKMRRQREIAAWHARLCIALAQCDSEAIVVVLAQAPCVGLSCESLVHEWAQYQPQTASTVGCGGVTTLRAVVAALTAAASGLSLTASAGSSVAPPLTAALGIKPRDMSWLSTSRKGSGRPVHLALSTPSRSRTTAAATPLRPLALHWLSATVRAVEQIIDQNSDLHTNAHSDAPVHQLQLHRQLLRECQWAAVCLAPNTNVACTLAERYLAAYGPLTFNRGTLVLNHALAEVGCALRVVCGRVWSEQSKDGEMVSEAAPSASTTLEAMFLALLADVTARASPRTEPSAVYHQPAKVDASTSSSLPLAPQAPAPPPAPHVPRAPVPPAAPLSPTPPPSPPLRSASTHTPAVALDLWAAPLPSDDHDSTDAAAAMTCVSFRAWYLHCLMTTGQFEAVGDLLSRAKNSTTADGPAWLAQALPTTAHQQLLARLPHDVLAASGVSAQLSDLVMTATCAELQARVENALEAAPRGSLQTRAGAIVRGDESTSTDAALRHTAHLFHVMQQQQRRAAPLSVTQHAVLYSRMLDYLVACCAGAESVARYHTHLRDLEVLFRVANMDALASSMVPGGDALQVVMIAEPDQRRADKVTTLVQAFSTALDFLCESPLLLSEPARDTAATTRTKVSSAATHLEWQRQQLQWRLESQDEVDTAIARGADLLSDLLLLCSDRSGCLPARAAEPAWRRELRQKHAVRAHKYQLLLSELPHTKLRDTVTTLLRSGYLVDAARVGHRLVEAHHVDLNYYSLTVLGALYQAMQLVDLTNNHNNHHNSNSSDADALSIKPDVLAKVRALYQRRQRVFGETGNEAMDASSFSSPPSSSGSGAAPATSTSSLLFDPSLSPLLRRPSPHSAPTTQTGTSTSQSTDLVVDPATTRALATVRVARACGVREGSTTTPPQKELLTFVHQLLHRSTHVPGGGLLISRVGSASAATESEGTSGTATASPQSAGVWIQKGSVSSHP